MATLYLSKQRNEFFTDKDGVRTAVKHVDEIKSYTIDWSRVLDASETISTSSWESSNVTTSSPTSTSTTTTVKVTGTDGHIQNTVVTSASRTLVEQIRFVAKPDGWGEMYYNG